MNSTREDTAKTVAGMMQGDKIEGTFAVRAKDPPREYKNKEGRYFFLTVGDKTGDIQLKFWGGSSPEKTLALYNSISVGDVIRLTGEVAEDRFEDRLVISMDEESHAIRVIEPGEVSGEMFLPTTDKDMEKQAKELREAVASVREPALRSLLDAFLDDDGFFTGFASAPASAMRHHNYLGGLMEHSLKVVRLSEALANMHPELDRDLLVTAAILHDIGKVSGYLATTSFEMTDQGRFWGHISLGVQQVRERMEGIPDFPKETEMKLIHMILSHHGKVEIGNSRGRGLKIPEAAALYYANLADAEVTGFLQARTGMKDVKDAWVYIRDIGNEVYMG